jgi:acyl-CoA hydrolase
MTTQQAAAPAKPTADPLADCVDWLLATLGKQIVMAAPLGLGKPNRLLNAVYQRVAADPSLKLQLCTALSLDTPTGSSSLEKRFLGPFAERHFGKDYPRLDYTIAQRRGELPANIVVEEFYVQSGAYLAASQLQRSYNSLNYTHVARAVASFHVRVLVQKVAREPGGTRLSLSCNPDLTFDLLTETEALGLPRPLLVAEVDPLLPYIGGTASVEPSFFDRVIDLPGPTPKLFALPREPVSDADFAIGLYSSALVKDGGTLQIGIGSLSDALCHALILRHSRNAEYLQMLEVLSPGLASCDLVRTQGGTGPFIQGLYGASEMVNDGFRSLHQAGILRRRVVDDVAVMQRVNSGNATPEDGARLLREGHWLNGGFYLGSTDLYHWLGSLPPEQAVGLGMTRISHINELYGGNEMLERLQRRDARFFNTCMMMTALGSAASDALEDGRVVSGVGGQYNFVAMAHALRDGRSVLLLRSTRHAKGHTASNILWEYGHCTIPRHLRDIVITEHGIADLRGATDEDCVHAMLALTAAPFQAGLVASAKAGLKLAADYMPPPALAGNTMENLHRKLAPFRKSGLLPDYPLGCDFTETEQRLVKALSWLKSATARTPGKLKTILHALGADPSRDAEAMQRMDYQHTSGWREWLEARLVALALERTR